jgi:hypothetical protein
LLVDVQLQAFVNFMFPLLGQIGPVSSDRGCITTLDNVTDFEKGSNLHEHKLEHAALGVFLFGGFSYNYMTFYQMQLPRRGLLMR